MHCKLWSDHAPPPSSSTSQWPSSCSAVREAPAYFVVTPAPWPHLGATLLCAVACLFGWLQTRPHAVACTVHRPWAQQLPWASAHLWHVAVAVAM